MSKRHASSKHHWPVRVYYEDTDAAGVVYYANYLKFCERARTEWLRALGFDQSRLRDEHSVVFVVRSVEAEYLRGAVLDDSLVVESHLAAVNRVKMLFAQKILRGDEVLFESNVGVVCIDWNKKKPASLPNEIRALLEILK